MNGQNNHTAKGLPESWQWTKLSDLAQINPKLPVEVKDESLEVSFLPMKLVEEEKNQIRLTENKSYKDVKKGFTPMIDGDVIFAKITPCMENGKIAVVHSLTNRIGFGSTEFHVLRCNGNLINKFLFYYLVQKQFRHEAESNMTGAVGQRRVPRRFLEESLIPLPTIEEQEEIVSRIEELFSELDKSIESLKTAQQQLKVYRQSVLKLAFEGKLTNEEVKEGKLPEGWKWVKIESLLYDQKRGMSTGPFGTMLKKHEHVLSGTPVLGIENIGEGTFQMPNKIFITREKAEELKNFKVKENDVIISRSGTVGEICIVPENMKNSVISTNLIRVRLNLDVISPKYFVYMFQGGQVREQVRELCKGSTRAFLNQGILSSLNFPYCDIKEQHLIVQEIESRLSVADKVEETIVNSLEQAEALRQSILKKAFEGCLL